MQEVFSEFVGQRVKVPYRDGDQIKVARGKLETINDSFAKIAGDLGTIIINTKNIEKMSRARERAW
jgi:hypothetical protein